ncbi:MULTISPECIES: TIR domain-containing protein [Leptolyngbya]|uniref:TIR domain-containing protein n=1 Tax=Leptolyngbya TaxID=47251 RepID=UPI001686D433|nr:toll/interleukin-1 receptor domain-containing protein [Leptolyngbya sp. FACHB-1624]
MSNLTPEPIEVFVSYSHRDELLRDELAKHLSILKRQGVIKEWHDREISPGSEWKGEIAAHLNSAKIILLLISADFLASDYCYDIELTKALERHDRKEACVIPIILRPVDWNDAPFGKLQALPENAVPVTKWENLDDAFLSVTRGIRQTIERLKQAHHDKLEQPERERQNSPKLGQIKEHQERQQQAVQQPSEQDTPQQNNKQVRKHDCLVKRLPWSPLTCLVLGYGLLGFLLSVSAAEIRVWALTLAGVLIEAGAWVSAKAWGWAWVLVGAWALSGALYGALGKVLNGSGASVAVGIWTLVFAGVWAGKQLLESFSRIDTCFILAFTSTIGLALGALTYWITHR